MLGSAVLVLLLALTSQRVAWGAEEQPSATLLLEVFVNGCSTGKIGEFVAAESGLMARAAELRELGIRVPVSVVGSDQELVAISALPGVAYSIDYPAQTVNIVAGAECLVGASVDFRTQEILPEPPGEPGMVLDYDVTATGVDVFGSQSTTSAHGWYELRAFAGSGVFSTQGLVSSHGTGASALRLESYLEYTNPASRQRWRLGDTITGGPVWSTPVRMAGLQWRRDFSLRPELASYPLPLVQGGLEIPSTVDVLVNNARIFTRSFPPGPFAVSQLPSMNGAGEITMVVTDLLGRQVSTTLPFYADTRLLKRGLDDFSVEVGWLRRGTLDAALRYGALAASASYRRGLTDRLTTEFHAESGNGYQVVGGGLAMTVADLASLRLSLAAGGARTGHGLRWSTALQRVGSRWTAGANFAVAQPAYRDLAFSATTGAVQRELTLHAGLNLPAGKTLNVAYSDYRRSIGTSGFRAGAETAATALPTGRSRLVSLTYLHRWRPATLQLVAFRDLDLRRASGLSLIVTAPLGRNTSAGMDTSWSGGSFRGDARIDRPAEAIGDTGFHLRTSVGESRGLLGEWENRRPWGRLSFETEQFQGATNVRGGLRGSIALLGGEFFLSAGIADSFAVVDTGGIAGVPVLRENRLVGRTGSHGRLLVPDLRSFEKNLLGIDDTSLSADITFDVMSREVRPAARSGVIVRFPVRRGSSAVVALVSEEGTALERGGVALLDDGVAESPVGDGGEVYFDRLYGRHRIDVQRPDGTFCQASFDFLPESGGIPRIGPVVCRRLER